MAKIGAYASYIKAKNKLNTKIDEAEIKDKDGKSTGYFIGSDGKIRDSHNKEVKETDKGYQTAIDALNDQEKHEEEAQKLNGPNGADISDKSAATAVKKYAANKAKNGEANLNPEELDKAQEKLNSENSEESEEDNQSSVEGNNEGPEETKGDDQSSTEQPTAQSEETKEDDKSQATKPEIQKKENDDTNIKALSDNAKQVSHFDATESTFGEYLNKFCKNVLAVLKQGDVGSEAASDAQNTEPSSTEVKESE